nr:hypothetical protein [Verrucomicrobium spinosum]
MSFHGLAFLDPVGALTEVGEDFFQPVDVFFGLAQVFLESRSKLFIGAGLGHLWQGLISWRSALRRSLSS